MEEILRSNDRLINFLTALQTSLAADHGEDALEVVRIIKNEGETFKVDIESAKAQLEENLKTEEAKLKISQDEYQRLGKEKEEASRQQHNYEIAQIVSGVAVANFSRDELEAQSNLNQARKEHEKAFRSSMYSFMIHQAIIPELRSAAEMKRQRATERLREAENRMQAINVSKERYQKEQTEAAKGYTNVKKEYKECKAQMKKIHQKWGALKTAVAFISRAYVEFQIILDLTESACSSTQQLKEALEREFLKRPTGVDEETTYLPLIPVLITRRVMKFRFTATKERWQRVRDAILETTEYLS